MADSALRQVLILVRLKRYPHSTSTKELKAYLDDRGLVVSIKTIQRDLNALSPHFGTVQVSGTGRGKEGAGWAISETAPNTSFPLMEPASALILLMGYMHLKHLFPSKVTKDIEPYIAEAEGAIKGLEKKSFGSWSDKVRIVSNNLLEPPNIDDTDLHTIYSALLTNKKFVATYKNRKEETFSPYGLVQRGHTLYLMARFGAEEKIRVTALHRYKNIEMTNQTITRDRSFDIDDYLQGGAMKWQFEDDKTINLKLSVDDWVARILEETPLSQEQKITYEEDEECFTVRAKVVETYELRAWLLSYDTRVEVLAPKKLRNWMANKANEVAAMYQ